MCLKLETFGQKNGRNTFSILKSSNAESFSEKYAFDVDESFENITQVGFSGHIGRRGLNRNFNVILKKNKENHWLVVFFVCLKSAKFQKIFIFYKAV